MSSKQFNHEPPWPLIDPETLKFERAGPTEDSSADFESKAWMSDSEVASEEQITAVPEANLNAEEIDDIVEEVENNPEEPTIVMTEREFEIRVDEACKQIKQETESNLTKDFEEKVKLIEESYSAFFDSLSISADQNQELTVEICDLAFKVGELLARGELTTKRDLISKFLENILEQVTEGESKSATISANPEWENVTKELKSNEKLKHLDFNVDETLSVGSVRVKFGNGGIEDVFEHRSKQLREQIMHGTKTTDEEISVTSSSEPQEEKENETDKQEIEISASEETPEKGDV